MMHDSKMVQCLDEESDMFADRVIELTRAALEVVHQLDNPDEIDPSPAALEKHFAALLNFSIEKFNHEGA